MILLEKLLVLKSVTLFQQTPDDLLMRVAATITKELFVKANDVIIEKGNTDTGIYVIVHGEVQIHDEHRLIKKLGEREIFGEFAAFAQSKRVASATAATDTLLLKLSSTGLYDLMSFNIGLTKGIIRALCLRNIEMSEQIKSLIP